MVIKIDPEFYSFGLLCASEHGKKHLTAKEWCQANKLVAAVNAGMFQSDGLTNVGYMKNFGHVNNHKFNDYKTILAFNPLDASIPQIKMIDRQCQDFEELRKNYNTLIQNPRMINCHQKNAWGQQKKIWSTVGLGIDKTGHVLFLFTRSPFSVHDFINILLSLPLSISTSMYLEGGPEASLYLSVNGEEIERFGSYETGFNEDDNNSHAWPIPNVIGIVKKNK